MKQHGNTSNIREIIATRVRREACELLGISQPAYNTLQFNGSLNYAMLFFRHDPVAAQLLANDGRYWTWWRNQWALRDDGFLRVHARHSGFAVGPGGAIISLREAYEAHHNPERLICLPMHVPALITQPILTRIRVSA